MSVGKPPVHLVPVLAIITLCCLLESYAQEASKLKKNYFMYANFICDNYIRLGILVPQKPVNISLLK